MTKVDVKIMKSEQEKEMSGKVLPLPFLAILHGYCFCICFLVLLVSTP